MTGIMGNKGQQVGAVLPLKGLAYIIEILDLLILDLCCFRESKAIRYETASFELTAKFIDLLLKIL
jgi:hypothetical protein